MRVAKKIGIRHLWVDRFCIIQDEKHMRYHVFAGALLWRMDTTCKRRKGKDGRTLHMFPSWSWVGWEGEPDLVWWYYNYPYMRKSHPSPVTLVPHVRMVKTNIETVKGEPVDNSYHKFTEKDCDIECAQPGEHPKIFLPVHKIATPTPPAYSQALYSPILTFQTTRTTLTISEYIAYERGHSPID
ncbi:hypothetical protein P171DRAFT_71881 [Karstenula rhodostoma CBS 690.94]|uniref:Heterokaryon incompatibility domain-containing protein n=1 Tax=Karstenula rhodostoma CBS 690.94 TaxID=1392251 RepID=A0A9P4PCN2_9PLEO|nr:hypothetical protein P171DRAFT_71881 [Karstenula rhodostoma CBS 690.94]